MANGTTDVDAVSYGSQIGLNTETASPPTSAYIGVDDQLQVFIASSATNPFVRMFARILLPDGRIVPSDWILFATNGRAGQNQYLPIPEGFLLSLTVYGPNSSTAGQTFCRVSLMRGTVAVAGISEVLAMGYVTLFAPLSWPFGQLKPPTWGRGNIRLITGTGPAAGAEISETVPTSALWNLISITTTLAASAAVANRLPVFLLQDGSGNTFFRRPFNGTALTAGLTGFLTWAAGATSATTATDYQAAIPGPTILPAGFVIKTSTTGIQAGDQYSAPIYVVEEWLQG